MCVSPACLVAEFLLTAANSPVALSNLRRHPVKLKLSLIAYTMRWYSNMHTLMKLYIRDWLDYRQHSPLLPQSPSVLVLAAPSPGEAHGPRHAWGPCDAYYAPKLSIKEPDDFFAAFGLTHKTLACKLTD